MGVETPLGAPYLPWLYMHPHIQGGWEPMWTWKEELGGITIDGEPLYHVALHPSCVAVGTCHCYCWGRVTDSDEHSPLNCPEETLGLPVDNGEIFELASTNCLTAGMKCYMTHQLSIYSDTPQFFLPSKNGLQPPINRGCCIIVVSMVLPVVSAFLHLPQLHISTIFFHHI